MENLIGKYYELLNIDNSVMVKFKINHVREVVTPSVKHDDGSISPQRTSIIVSEKGRGWYNIYGGLTDRITSAGVVVALMNFLSHTVLQPLELAWNVWAA